LARRLREHEHCSVRRVPELVEQRDLASMLVPRWPEQESQPVLVGGFRDAVEDPREVLVEDDRDEDADALGLPCAHIDAPTGSSTEIVVPPPGGLTTLNRPASAFTRSLRPVKPEPTPSSAPPTPSSVTVARIADASPATVTKTDVARECLIAFASASDTT